jgi:hypothetical protein
MDMAGIRAQLVSRLNTAWATQYPSTKVFYENAASIDLDSVGTQFLVASVHFNMIEQASIDTAPISRYRGYFNLSFFVKEGQGTKVAVVASDYLFSLFKYGNYSGVHTGAPTPGKSGFYKGWYFQEMHVPFWADSIS